MKKLGLNQLRSMFKEFYQSKGHEARHSFPLVPEKDKSLLIINSGMAPLKPYFAGLETPPNKRMTTCQKCIRTGDIENVGYTSRHGTFFEMLGSFSFGDYFKEQSLLWGWEFITQVLQMPQENLWASVYEGDGEAYDIWKNQIGMPEERIVRLGKADNFWEIGIGPCGPCSEIYYDRGEAFGCDNPNCQPGCDCDRYVEFWNHVFTQFNRDEEGNYTPLAHPNIDTGMGLERLACIMQDVDSIFDVDTIRFILEEVVALCGVKYEQGTAKTDISIRIITDHLRSVTFMIADDILPSNEGRGYVLRRLLRRAARHGKLLGIQGKFLADLSKKVIEVSGDAYPELVERSAYIHKIISVEEEKFHMTIDQGTAILAGYIAELKTSGNTALSGESVFKLYDTYGFPLELTQEILEESGYSADVDDFHRHMLHQKEQARAARKSETDAGWADNASLFADQNATLFTGYESLLDQGEVCGLFRGTQAVTSVKAGEKAILLLDRTPFYGESGGQVGDLGVISHETAQADVLSVGKAGEVFTHEIFVQTGEIQVGDRVQAAVDGAYRNQIARNHTATHLLHKALKELLGSHVEQKGSRVAADGLRFDFSHFEGITEAQLAAIEEQINRQINLFLPVKTELMTIEEATKSKATALFGEKYGDQVRVVSVGDYSTELCGGIHVVNTGQIGALKIVSESGVAGGVRRIEAITGTGLYTKLKEEESLLHTLAELLKTNAAGLANKAAATTEELRQVKRELEELKKKSMGAGSSSMIAEAKEINGVRLITKAFSDYDINDLRNLSDQLKAEAGGNLIQVLATENGGKVTFMVSVSDDLLEKGHHAGNMIKKIAAAAGGGGGGKADMAQAGAKDPAKIPAAFEVAATLLA